MFIMNLEINSIDCSLILSDKSFLENIYLAIAKVCWV